MVQRAPTAEEPSAEGGRLDVEALVREYHAQLYRYAYRLSGSVQDAEDLTQHVFLTAATKGDQLRDAESVRGWLFTILRNTYLKMNRRRTPLPATGLDLDVESIPEELEEGDFDGERLQAALDDLPDEFKMVVLLFYFEECSYREIAARLDVPEGTVMSRLSRAKRHLRKRLLKKEAVEPDTRTP